MADACAPVATTASISINEDNAVAFTLNGINPDAQPSFAAVSLQFSVVSGPFSGTLSGTTPNLTCTPNAGFSSTDSFTFGVNDGASNSTAATASITVSTNSGSSSDSEGSGGSGNGSSRKVILNPQTGKPSTITTTTYPESYFEENPLDKIQILYIP
ncbi:Ig-like domain-containing protein [Candidatus Nitrososphaera gargensis]|uniref:Ig-like domain-containing protein n=1 Tax=Candidatus Nitrososphaera gargensis TaxID=497727 RepID=UPI001E611C64|nr:Ig-like domain-containing protein [Candidatus Nitrososphaera gargensis]